MLLNPFILHTPSSLSEAIRIYSHLDDVKLQAGGTFLLNNLKMLKRKGMRTPQNVISLRKVKDLKGISEDKNSLKLMAMTTMSTILESPLLKGNMEVLKTVAKNIGTCAIRNMATIGGNLTCRFTWTEMPAVMVALEADLLFMGPDGKEVVVPAEEFYKADAKTDKLFTCVRIKKNAGAVMAYRRVKKSPYVDIPQLSLLIKTDRDKDRFGNTRVGVNNCVDFAQRDLKLEDFLNRNKRSKTIAREALDHLEGPIYDTRASDYKKHMFRVSLKEAIMELVGKR